MKVLPRLVADGDHKTPSEVATHVARAAARLFAARGYDATSVREIVEAAGVTKPTLYYHFGSKEGLAQALLTRPMNGLIDQLGRIVDGESDPRAMMAAILDAHFAFCLEDPDRCRFLYALFFGPLASSLANEVAGIGQQFDAIWERAARRFAECGLVPSDKIPALTAHLRGLSVIYTVDHLYRGQELGPDLGARLVDDLLNGFLRPSPSRSER